MTPVCAAKLKAALLVSFVSTPTKLTEAPNLRATASIAGISLRHGMHHDAQKLSTSGRPRKLASDTRTRGSRRLGIENPCAGLPGSRLNPAPLTVPREVPPELFGVSRGPKTAKTATTIASATTAAAAACQAGRCRHCEQSFESAPGAGPVGSWLLGAGLRAGATRA